MGVEIERKFLVRDTTWKAGPPGRLLRQGYLSSADQRTVRVRLADDEAWLTIKGPSVGITRAEFEYAIPPADAAVMLETLCVGSSIDKTRYRIEYAGHVWDVDEFHGPNHGLLTAEIELTAENEPFARPPWLGRDVSGDPRYANSQLALKPYSTWSDNAS